MTQIAIADAAPGLQELIRKARHGEEVIFLDGDQPAAKLVPVVPRNEPALDQRPIGTAKGLVRMSDDFDEPLPEFES